MPLFLNLVTIQKLTWVLTHTWCRFFLNIFGPTLNQCAW